MKQVIKEYLASVREREVLDAIVPDLMSETGFHVYSRPSRGVQQYGVDVAAVRTGDDGVRRLYLVTIKRGDLTNVDWDSGNKQDVRRSLNEMRESYLRRQVPRQLAHLDVVIVVCCGGDIKENVRGYLTDYVDKHSEPPRLTFEEWDGDHLAGQIERGLLREGLLTGRARAALRESLATCDDPETSYDQFAELIRMFVEGARTGGDAAIIAQVRRMSICLHILWGAGREARNLEAPYMASEYVLLQVWSLSNLSMGRKGKIARTLGELMSRLTQLHLDISDEYIAALTKHVGNRNAVSQGVWTAESLDVNLKLFDVLGRLSLRGLWTVWGETVTGELPTKFRPVRDAGVRQLATMVRKLVDSNQVLVSPITDDQVIELALAFMFLAADGHSVVWLRGWIQQIFARLRHAFMLHRAYPCIFTDYSDLLEHPRPDDAYRERATEGSVLIPTLAWWMAATGDVEALGHLAEFCAKDYSHSTLQLWLPHDDSEAHLYLNDDSHGAAYTDIPVTADPDKILDYVKAECGENTPFFELSAVAQGYWPLVLIACRHHRLPVPPHFWQGLVPPRKAPSPPPNPMFDLDAASDEDAPPRAWPGYKGVRVGWTTFRSRLLGSAMRFAKA